VRRETRQGNTRPFSINRKVLGDTRVLCSELTLFGPLEIIKDKIVEHLNRYLVADEVKIADRIDGMDHLAGAPS
jgi:hypothetical protein